MLVVVLGVMMMMVMVVLVVAAAMVMMVVVEKDVSYLLPLYVTKLVICADADARSTAAVAVERTVLNVILDFDAMKCVCNGRLLEVGWEAGPQVESHMCEQSATVGRGNGKAETVSER